MLCSTKKTISVRDQGHYIFNKQTTPASPPWTTRCTALCNKFYSTDNNLYKSSYLATDRWDKYLNSKINTFIREKLRILLAISGSVVNVFSSITAIKSEQSGCVAVSIATAPPNDRPIIITFLWSKSFLHFTYLTADTASSYKPTNT